MKTCAALAAAVICVIKSNFSRRFGVSDNDGVPEGDKWGADQVGVVGFLRCLGSLYPGATEILSQLAFSEILMTFSDASLGCTTYSQESEIKISCCEQGTNMVFEVPISIRSSRSLSWCNVRPISTHLRVLCRVESSVIRQLCMVDQFSKCIGADLIMYPMCNDQFGNAPGGLSKDNVILVFGLITSRSLTC